MPKISRSDKVIVTVLVVVLAGLVVAAALHQSGRSRSAAATTAQGTASPSTAEGGSTSTTGSPVPASSTTTSATSSTTGAVTGVGPGGPPVPGPVSAVGDSIMLDIQSDLQADIPGSRVDGLVSRQFDTGIGIVQADRASGTLGNVLVIELGTNGSVTSSDFDAMMQAASGVRRVVFVNVNVPRPWEAGDNATLAAGVARYPGVAVLADWNALSTPHPEWFTPDQVHLQPAGAQALAALITRYA
jgi:lysophospholipase L1-like esterase